MSNYTFTFKKDDMFVEFTTTDKDVVERQFKIWVTCASVYSYNKTKQPVPEVQPQREPEKMAPEQKQEFKQEIVEAAEKAHEDAENIDALFHKPTINTLQNPSEQISNPVEFGAILENSMENSTFEPKSTKDERFLKIIKMKNITEKLDYLLITAYYLSEFDKLDRFTLKQVNAKLMHNISEVIDHSVSQEAIDRGYVEVVSDFTGVAGSSEYRLTECGEEAFLNGTK